MAKKEVAFFGISNMKYAMRGETPTIKPIVGAKNLGLTSQISTQPLYADNKKVFEAISDQGYEGNIGLTVRPIEYETDLGLALKLAVGTAQTSQTDAPLHEVYFEYEIGYDDNTTKTAKVWLFGVSVRKAAQNFSTRAENIEFGEYSMPVTATPQQIMDATGANPFRNESGHIVKTSILVCMPGEEGYDTFENTVPVLKVPTA